MSRSSFAIVALALVAASVTWTAGIDAFEASSRSSSSGAELTSAGAPAAAAVRTFADSATREELAYARAVQSASPSIRTFADSATSEELAYAQLRLGHPAASAGFARTASPEQLRAAWAAFASAPATRTFADPATPDEVVFAHLVFADR